jgi:fumarate reductase flavoprotein subunit
MTTRSDVLVVGGGMAGIIAGARAAELGLAVTVLEQGRDAHYACNARWSGGVLHVAYNDIKSPPASLQAVIERDTVGKADAAQARALAGNGGRLLDWLTAHGASWVGTKVDWQQFILEPMRAMRAGLDWEDRGPDRLLTRLCGLIRSKGGRVVLDARARSLVMQDRRCAGVEAIVAGRPETFAAHAVILADGGFQANLELLGRHVSARPDRIKQRGAANGHGDGLAMAVSAGAATTGMDLFYGHILSRDAFGNDRVWPYPELDALATSGILVDTSGRRLTDEGLGGIAVTNALAKSDDPLGATIVCDTAIWEGPGRSARIPANPTLEAAGGTVHRASTLESLAGMAGLDAKGLVATVAAYNRALAEGALATLSPPRTSAKHKARPIVTAPFVALPVCPGITYTMGGIVVDGASRVLRPDGSIIEGLLAAGSNTGGLEGHGNLAYVGGLAKAGVQGLVAAETVAATLEARA